MKTLDQIISTPRPAVNNGWKDRPMVSSYDPFRGMTAADFDGIGHDDAYIAGIESED